ncbi:phage tail assembly chaperone [Burkholderia sp. SR8]|uniref:phage tail assembly chaperone n=1 Tax=Burkholderia sp. SR8 TaxID=3062277 RepID=UPI0040646E49
MGQKQAAYDSAGKIIGFYDSKVSPVPAEIPAVEITDDQWEMLLAGQANGMCMALDLNLTPILLDPKPLTRAELADMMRSRRDAALNATDWLVARHQDEKLIGDGTTLSADQFTVLVKYRQALRDLSDATGWPNCDLPLPPPFVNEAEGKAR